MIHYDSEDNLSNDTYTSYGLSTYDAENRMLTARDIFGGTINYSFDGDGRRVRRVSNNTQVWQVYRMDGFMITSNPRSKVKRGALILLGGKEPLIDIPTDADQAQLQFQWAENCSHKS